VGRVRVAPPAPKVTRQCGSNNCKGRRHLCAPSVNTSGGYEQVRSHEQRYIEYGGQQRGNLDDDDYVEPITPRGGRPRISPGKGEFVALIMIQTC
jgi:hypothetical protein